VRHHRDNCITAKIQKYKALHDEEDGEALIRELEDLTQKTELILSRALAKKGEGELALKAIARRERQLELKARLLGMLEEKSPAGTRVEVVYIDKAVIAAGAIPPAQLPAGGNL
jgi:hypothetical protein